jgi:hypothetical protein
MASAMPELVSSTASRRIQGITPQSLSCIWRSLPTAGDVLGSGELDHAFTFLVSKDLGKHHFDFNTVVNLLGRPPGGFDYDSLNALAWSHPLVGRWGTTAELSGGRRRTP